MSPAWFADSTPDCLADESAEDRSDDLRDGHLCDGLRVRRVSDAASVSFVADRPEPKNVLGFVPVAVELEGPPASSATVSVVDEGVDDPDGVLVDPVVLADPVEALVEPDDEFEDDCPPSSANAAPIPAVPANPATPSEKATAPTRNATFAEFTSGPTPPPDR